MAAKNLTLAEEYLADHFPGFPVMPGVLMLEAAAQSAAWLIRVTDDFAHSIVLMKTIKAVKYGGFVTPGRQLVIEAEVVRHDATETELKIKGVCDGANSISGRLVMQRYNLRDRDPALAETDAEIVRTLRAQLPRLRQQH